MERIAVRPDAYLEAAFHVTVTDAFELGQLANKLFLKRTGSE
jgi:hypothetical protein